MSISRHRRAPGPLAIACVAALLVASARAQAPPAPQLRFDAAVRTAASLPRMRSLLVSWQGELVLERYFNGARADATNNIKSVSKSVLSALIGIAIDRGHIAGVEQPIRAYFSDELRDTDNALKTHITVENLLTMQSGLETTSNRNYGAWVASADWVGFALRQPLLFAPGRLMEYSTGNTHLLSALLTRATGQTTLAFAREVLAEPLGFDLAPWPQDPKGVYFGGNDMQMTPRQMRAFGELYLNGGRAGGTQIVPAEWVAASLVPRVQSRGQRSRYYGYGWWIRDMAGHETPYAWGFGGQFIVLVPALDLVVVTTSSSDPGPERRGHTRRIYDLVEHEVIAAAAQGLGHPPVPRPQPGYSASGQ